MHYHYVTDGDDIVDLIPFCCDACHQDWCKLTQTPYEGWSGAQEGADYPEFCANCGVIANAGEDGCCHQRDNVLVNRFPSTKGEKCHHGNWLQLPYKMLRLPVTK